MTSDPRQENGSVLIIVLWWLVILSIMAAALYAFVRPRIELASRLRDRAVGHHLAVAAMRVAMVQVKDDETPAFDALNELWSRNPEVYENILVANRGLSVAYRAPVPFEEEPELHYGLQDEERKININRVPREVLERLFEHIGGLPSVEASAIAGAIIDWRDEDDDPVKYGAESSYYSSLSPPYEAKNGVFQVPRELMLVKGMTAEIYHRVADSITVFGTGAVNINTADAAVLTCLGITPSLADKVLDCRAGPDGIQGTEDDTVFESVAGIVPAVKEYEALSNDEVRQLNGAVNTRVITVRSDNFRGQVFKKLDKTAKEMHITFVFNRNGLVQYWHEF
ncbi:MAG: general secretion pathway protein GspK [Candidatus Pacebacteria bacterium]|nr:general secretion pathway protein GspK [Candidatus Paceibacterota bacterium]